MKMYKKILGASAVALALGFTGCDECKDLDGIVVEEFGTAARLVESKGPLSKDVLIKSEDLTYGLVLETADGTYTLDIDNYHKKPILALAKAIEPGDRVLIDRDVSTRIDRDKVGTTDSDTVEIIEKNSNSLSSQGPYQ